MLPIDLFLHRKLNKDGTFRVKCTIDNMKVLLRSYGLAIWYNQIKRDLECSINGVDFKEDNNLNRFYGIVLSCCIVNDMPTTLVSDFITNIAFDNTKNPVKDWIDSKEWDRKKRTPELFSSIETKAGFDSTLKEALIKKWLISCYAALVRANDDDFWSKGVLILQGKQNLGKTLWYERLMGGNTQWFKRGMIIDVRDKDTIEQANSFWIVELDEEEIANKKTLPSMKAYVADNKNILRKAFAKYKEIIHRKTMYCATVNHEEFLHDRTGNVRFWTIPVEKIHDTRKIDMQQLWAEIKEYYKQGDKWWLEPHEEQLLNESNVKHEVTDSIDDLIGSKFEWESDKILWYEAKSVTEILMDCGIKEPTQSQKNKAGFVLRRLLKLDRAPDRDSYNVIKYKVPPRVFKS